jgi:hypothetical protein
MIRFFYSVVNIITRMVGGWYLVELGFRVVAWIWTSDAGQGEIRIAAGYGSGALLPANIY